MRVTLLVMIGLWLSPLRLSAQSPGDLERAKAAFKAGAAAYGAGDYAAAIQALETAYTITPLPAIAFSLAQAERRQYFVTHALPHLERALSLFRRYLEQVPSGGRRADALEALAQLEPIAAREGLPLGLRGVRASEAPRPTRLMVSTQAASARVSIDGAEAAAAPWIQEVRPGPHRVTVAAPGYVSSEREVVAVAGELILAEIALRERPALLLLSTPARAEVFVDGRFARHGGAAVQLALPSGVHELAVARTGRRSFAQRLTLERGATQGLSVSLPPTRQRLASRALFILSGASLATAIVLGASALRMERRAERFLALRAEQTVSPAALDDYEADVRARNRLRTAAVVTLSAAAGVLVAALLLYQLDRPDERARADRRLGPQARAAASP